MLGVAMPFVSNRESNSSSALRSSRELMSKRGRTLGWRASEQPQLRRADTTNVTSDLFRVTALLD